MNALPILQSLTLLTLANGAPVIAKKIFGHRFAYPLDGGLLFIDARPLLGASKTIRGILAALLVTTAAAPLLGIAAETAAGVAAVAMLGDLSSSFLKRRLGRPPSSRALLIDQGPESLFPLLACQDALALSAADIVIAVAVFFVGEILLSRLLFKVHLRDEPY